MRAFLGNFLSESSIAGAGVLRTGLTAWLDIVLATLSVCIFFSNFLWFCPVWLLLLVSYLMYVPCSVTKVFFIFRGAL